ncbi:MAG: surface lipoprotein assembly modifier [Pseudomonadota bacterium]
MMTRLLFCLCKAIAVCAGLAGPAAAQVPGPLELIQARDFDGARAALDAQNASPLDRRFAEALIAQSTGDRLRAIAELREILRVRPDLVAPRRILASLLAQTGQYGAAEFQYRQLVELDPNTDNRSAYNRALRTLFARKPFGFTASGAIVPSTNINRGTATEIFPTDFGDFIIDEDNLGQTGIGLSLDLGVFRRFELPGGRRLQLDAKTALIVYDKAQFNQHSFTLRATLSDARDGKSYSVAPEISRAYLAGERYYDRVALALARGWTLNPKTALILRAQGEYRDYTTSDSLTGPRYELGAEVRRRLDPRTSLTGSLAYKIGNTESPAFQYDGIELGVRANRAFENGIQLGLGLSYETRPYRGDFTGLTFARQDNITALDVSVFNDKWTFQGAAPTYSCKLTWAQSNVAFYDYTVQECSIGFTRNF